MVIYIYAKSYPTEGFVARAGPCLRDSGRNQPIVGMFEINLFNFFTQTFSDQINIALHEVSHVLVFLSTSINLFVKKDGSAYTAAERTQTITIRGKSAVAVVYPNVVAKAKEIFGCSTLVGPELEDRGLAAGVISSHWEVRIVPHDVMVSVVPNSPVMSELTIALYEDSGWYTVSYDYAQPLVWGRNVGCSWFTDKCITSTNVQPGFCGVSDKEMCNVFGTGAGICRMSTYTSTLPTHFQYFSNPLVGGRSDYVDYCPTIST